MARILISGLLLLLTFAAPLCADEFDRFKATTRLFVETSHFYWDEHNHGAKLLDETGMLYGLGLSLSDICATGGEAYRLTFGGKAQYAFGTVDYDGTIMETGAPVQTDVEYSEITVEAYLGTMFKTGNPDWFVEPKLTLGYRNRGRDILSNAQARGYKESWQTCYSRLGVTAIVFMQKAYSLSLSGGAIIPLWAVNDVNIYGQDVGVSPEPFHPTPYAEVGLEYKRVGIAAYYEAFSFGKSDPSDVYVEELDSRLLQPESYEERFGIRLTVAFY